MAANTVLNYLPRESVVHRLTGTTKLAFFLLFTFASMITYNTWVLLGLLAVSISAFKLEQDPLQRSPFYDDFYACFFIAEQPVHLPVRPGSGNNTVWHPACTLPSVLEV